MKQTPYYRSLGSIVSILTGGAAGVAASTLFDPPSTGVTPVKISNMTPTVKYLRTLLWTAAGSECINAPPKPYHGTHG